MPIILKDIQSGYNLAEINNNFKTIERTWDEKLDRLVSLQGNQMSVDLDMNSKAILNVKPSDNKNSLVNKGYVDDANEIQDKRLGVLEESFDVGSGTSSVSWTYIAAGGETSVSPPFHFNNVRELHVNGLLKTEHLEWSWTESQGQQINLATALSVSDVVVVRVGGESEDLIPPDVTLEDIYGVPVFELRVGMVISPVNDQYPKLKAFNAIYELADNSVSYTVKSFAQSVGGDCVITLSDDTPLIAKKVDAASREWSETNFERTFDTVFELKSAKNIRSKFVKTLGYYTVGDGGGASYYIKSGHSSNNLLNPNLHNNKYAVIRTSKIYAKQAGARSDADATASYQSIVDFLGIFTGGTVYTDDNYVFEGTQNSLGDISRLLDGVTLKSNISFVGLPDSSIRCGDTCAQLFTGRFRATVTEETNLKNIKFKSMKLKMNPVEFYAFNNLLVIDSCNGFTIDDCDFEGWSGDAILFGAVSSSDMSQFFNGIVKNVVVKNSRFDGIDKNNRQAISVLSCDGFEVYDNKFKNISRSDMPGCIDFEPELLDNYILNVKIHDNNFKNIGGSVAVVTLALGTKMAIPPKTIKVYSNTFDDCTNKVFYIIGHYNNDAENISPWSPSNIEIISNTATNCGLFSVALTKKCLISNNEFTDCRGNVRIGIRPDGSEAANTKLAIKGNSYTDCRHYTSDPYIGFISIFGKLDGFQLRNETFIDSGRFNGETAISSLIVNFSGGALKSVGVVIKDNVHTAVEHSFDGTPSYFTSGKVLHPRRWIIGSNSFNGISNKPAPFNLYSQIVVTGDDSIVTDYEEDPRTYAGWNGASHFDVTTLPDDLKYGQLTSISSGIAEFNNQPAAITSIKVAANNTQRYMNYQVATSFADPSKVLTRRPIVDKNEWRNWVTFVGS